MMGRHTCTHIQTNKILTNTTRCTCSSCSESLLLVFSLVATLELIDCLFVVVVAAAAVVTNEALPVICSIACINLLLGPNNLVHE